MKNARIIGVGHYVPERVVTNHDLEKMMDTSDEWIRERTGIVTRHWVREGETITDLAYNATNMALERAGLKPEDIDFIIVASIAGDAQFPGNGCFLQARMEIPGVPAMDIRNACSGFVYALAVADKFIKTETYRNILVVGAEIQSTGLDLSTRGRDMAVLFGDGAGAAVVTATDEPDRGILTTHLHADGRYATKLWSEFPSVINHPYITHEIVDSDRIYPKMEGRYVFKHAVSKFPEAIMEALEATGYTVEDLDLVIPHQANQRITEAVAQKLGISMDKIVSNIHKYGNTTAASIPIAMSEAWEEGRIKDGDLICLAAFGAGFTWGSVLLRW
ncbi:MAG: ketoacyl-ACP synthase III [Calditrichaeota bacterium]|nr:ketoacyl-ACP synthase III [Calditrichota bacterium]